MNQSYSLGRKGQTLRSDVQAKVETVEVMDEDDAGEKTAKHFETLVFDTLSIEELNAYIVELKEEITRTEAAIDAKRGFRDSAEDVFSG